MNDSKIEMMREAARAFIMQKQNAEGLWTGQLSSSAISTSVALFAVQIFDASANEANVSAAAAWLLSTMQENGTWGDSPESPSNMTATLLSFAALFSIGKAPKETKDYLSQCFGGFSDTHIVKGVTRYYGKDLTFSGPILAMCALSGVLSDWRHIPAFPFELALFPQSVYRFLRLPVVSYAIPAFIAVGLLSHTHVSKHWYAAYRTKLIEKSLTLLQQLQPIHGGYLEAAPLTGFVALCLSGAGFRNHEVTRSSIAFLLDTQRSDGSWPIDTNLSTWITTLVAKTIGGQLPESSEIAQKLKGMAEKERHPFTGVQAGGWGWTSLPGSVPDADDTSGALIALHTLTQGTYSPEVEKGILWLRALQNRDGGIPTFCKGWGKLPFDRSAPDITAHALLAMQKWLPEMPENQAAHCTKAMRRMLVWMQKNQSKEGSMMPLWFGDQDAPGTLSPVYGTATTVDYLSSFSDGMVKDVVAKGLNFLLENQNPDGGWGGIKGASSKTTLTARSLAAIASAFNRDLPLSESKLDVALSKGLVFLEKKFDEGNLFAPEPIGLYFSKLWYSEEMYPPIFVLQALNAILENKKAVKG